MSNTVLFWIFCAIILFWGVGAYNRIVRLRAQAITAFAPLQSHYEQYVLVMHGHFESFDDEDRLSARSGLFNAVLQFDISLKAAGAHPLDSLVMRALETAHEALHGTWIRVCCEPQDLEGEPLPETLQKQWGDISLHAERDRAEFKHRVQDYNQGIQQFPANLLAWLFRFKPAYWEKKLHDEH
jgi:LemA protein